MKRKIEKRKLLNGGNVPTLQKEIKWDFASKCPAKWVHVDCETGDLWQWDVRKNTYIRVGDIWELDKKSKEYSRVVDQDLLESVIIAIARQMKFRREKVKA